MAKTDDVGMPPSGRADDERMEPKDTVSRVGDGHSHSAALAEAALDGSVSNTADIDAIEDGGHAAADVGAGFAVVGRSMYLSPFRPVYVPLILRPPRSTPPSNPQCRQVPSPPRAPSSLILSLGGCFSQRARS